MCIVFTEDNADDSGRATQETSAAHAAVVKITVELKQLELLAAQIEESTNRLSAVAADAVTASDNLQTSLDVAAEQNDQVNVHHVINLL